jgi:hypothetical protein
LCRFGRKLSAAADTDAVGRILGDFHIAVFAAHNHSSFFTHYTGGRKEMQEDQFDKEVVVSKWQKKRK